MPAQHNTDKSIYFVCKFTPRNGNNFSAKIVIFDFLFRAHGDETRVCNFS